MKPRKKVFIVDDHKMFREGLIYLISQSDDYEFAGDAPDGSAFLKELGKLSVDLVLMDISMPVTDGISAATKALKENPAMNIIILTMACGTDAYNLLSEAGVKGFILKESGKDELFRALDAVSSGQKFYSQKLLQKMIIKPESCFVRYTPGTVILSPEENNFLQLLCEGLTLNSIAEKLSVSLRTAESLKSGLLTKTGTKNPVDLVVFALKNHLMS